MCKGNYFTLFCKSYLVLFLTFIMTFRFSAAPPHIGTVLRIFEVAFVRALTQILTVVQQIYLLPTHPKILKTDIGLTYIIRIPGGSCTN